MVVVVVAAAAAVVLLLLGGGCVRACVRVRERETDRQSCIIICRAGKWMCRRFVPVSESS